MWDADTIHTEVTDLKNGSKQISYRFFTLEMDSGCMKVGGMRLRCRCVAIIAVPVSEAKNNLPFPWRFL